MAKVIVVFVFLQKYVACCHLRSSLGVLITIFMFYWVNGRTGLSNSLASVIDENDRAIPKPIISYHRLIEKLCHKRSW